jgi:CRISPR-associated protein Cas1
MARQCSKCREVVILDWNGRFRCRMTGPTSGNVLLRQAQYEVVRDPERAALIARNIVAGKVKNSREVLLRSARESDDVPDTEALHRAAERLAGPEIHLRMSGHRCSIRAIETWFAQDDQER